MKTQTIEVDDSTALVLQQRAAERGVTVPELVAELATIAVGPLEVDIAELDRRWKAFEAQDSVTSNDEVVRWLQTWGTPAFRSWRNRMKLEWSDAALADIDRFVEFLNREHPSLAGVVAGEIVGKVQVLSEHQCWGGRSLAGKSTDKLYCRS